MKPKKQKRIRAEMHYLYLIKEECLCFCIPVNAVPALIEQMADDYLAYFDGPPPKSHAQAITYALKRAGITTPKGGAKNET